MSTENHECTTTKYGLSRVSTDERHKGNAAYEVQFFKDLSVSLGIAVVLILTTFVWTADPRVNEYARAKYHGAWAAGQDTTDVGGEVTMLVTTYSTMDLVLLCGLSDRPDTVIWYVKVTRTTKADPCRRQKQKQNRK